MVTVEGGIEGHLVFAVVLMHRLEKAPSKSEGHY